jgi:hypothetical protein
MPPVFLALALLFAAPADAGGGAVFGPGEQITYQVKWLGLPAGSGQVTVGAETPERSGLWPIVTVGRSDVVLYPIKQKIVVWWDPATSRSRELALFADEGGHRFRKRIEFQPESSRARWTYQEEGKAAKTEEHEVPPDTADAASAVFILRNQRLAVGDEISFPIFTGTKLFQGHASVLEKVDLETPLGTRPAVKVRLRTEFSGKLTARELRMWFSDDPVHVPMRLEADFVVGPVVVEWIDYQAGRAMKPSSVARGDAALHGRSP